MGKRNAWMAGVALAALTACTAGDNFIASKYFKSELINAEAGGTITVTAADSQVFAGAQVYVPPGALTADTRIGIGYGSNTGILPSGSGSAGPAVDLGPNGAQFRVPVKVTLPFSLPSGSQQTQLVIYALESNGQTSNGQTYQIGNSALTISGAFVSFPVNGFTQFQPGAAEYLPPPPHDGGSPDDGGNPDDGGPDDAGPDAGCSAGLTLCGLPDGGFCTDTLTDSLNCGSCGIPCPSGSCVNGSCTTPGCNPVPTYGSEVLFSPPVAYSTTKAPWKIVTADFNKDGIQDLVTAGGGLMFGLADGGLSAGSDLGDGWAWSTSVVDVNADGWPDIVMAGCLGTVDIWLNQQDGTFSPFYFPSTGMGCVWGVGVADFNGDGLPDLATCTANGIELSFGVDAGGGGGVNFTTPVSLSVASCIDLASFQDPGRPASLATIHGDSTPVSVWAGIGDGGFAAPVDFFPVGDGGVAPDSVITADLNNDGFPDLLVSGGSGLVVYLNQGNGTFGMGAVTPAQSGYSVRHISVVDMNNDGYPDVLAAGDGNCDGLQASDSELFVNDCSGAFPSSVVLNAPGVKSIGIAALRSADASRPGVVLGDFCNGEIAVLPLDVPPDGGACFAAPDFGAGVLFPIPQSFPLMPSMYSMTLVSADFNQDGIPDVVSWLGAVFYGLSDGGFAAGSSIADTPAYALQAADLNGDGWPDVVMEHCGTEEAAPGHVGIWMNQHDGTFAGYSLLLGDGGDSECTSGVAAADFDDDGVLDLAVCSKGNVVLLRGDGGFMSSAGGAPGYQDAQPVSSDWCFYLTTWPGPNARAALATVYPVGGAGLLVWPNVVLMDGGMAAPTIYYESDAGSEGIPWAIQATDMNRDGVQDLVVSLLGDGIGILLGLDGTNFSPMVVASPVPGFLAYHFALVDLNGDGYPDVVSAGDGANCNQPSDLQVFVNDCNGGLVSVGDYDAGIPNPIGVAAVSSATGLPSIAAVDYCTGAIAIMPNLTVH